MLLHGPTTLTVTSIRRPRSSRNIRTVRSQQNTQTVNFGGTMVQGGAQPGREAVPLPVGVTSRYLRIIPSKVEFKDVEPGMPLLATISVLNISAMPRRVRVAIPKAKEFAVRYDPLPAIAPGMDCKIQVEFYTDADEAHSIHSSFVVAVEGDEIVIPLIAEAPRPDVRFDPFCAFGQVNVGAKEIRYVELVNHGSKGCDFELVEFTASKAISVDPLQGRLGPDGSDDSVMTLKVTVDGSEAGSVQSILRLRVDGASTGKALDVSANVCRCVLAVTDPTGGGLLDSLNFGSIYLEERVDIVTTLINDSPCGANFWISIPRPDGELQDDDEEGPLPREKQPYSVLPANGFLKPFEQREVTWTYHPASQVPERGFKNQQATGGEVMEHAVEAAITVISATAADTEHMVRTLSKTLSMTAEPDPKKRGIPARPPSPGEGDAASATQTITMNLAASASAMQVACFRPGAWVSPRAPCSRLAAFESFRRAALQQPI